MDRNLLRRVEVAFPVLDRGLKKRVIEEGLLEHLSDNTGAWLMDAEGQYTRRKPGRAAARNSQARLMKRLGEAHGSL